MFDQFGMMGWGGAMGLFWALLLVLLVVWLVRGFGSSNRRSDTPSAREILDQRYARGEIDGDEYRQRLADLNRP